jgi:hypothetical protein
MNLTLEDRQRLVLEDGGHAFLALAAGVLRQLPTAVWSLLPPPLYFVNLATWNALPGLLKQEKRGESNSAAASSFQLRLIRRSGKNAGLCDFIPLYVHGVRLGHAHSSVNDAVSGVFDSATPVGWNAPPSLILEGTLNTALDDDDDDILLEMGHKAADANLGRRVEFDVLDYRSMCPRVVSKPSAGIDVPFTAPAYRPRISTSSGSVILSDTRRCLRGHPAEYRFALASVAGVRRGARRHVFTGAP